MRVVAVPDDMRSYARAACAAGEEVAGFLRRRTLPVLVSFPVAPGLEHRLVRLLEGCRGLDEWVGQLAEVFAAADSDGFVGPVRPGETVADDAAVVAGALLGCGLGAAGARRLLAPLTHAEALAVGRVIASRLADMTPALEEDDVRRLRRQLAPLRDKLRAPYRRAVADAYAGTSGAASPPFPDGYGEVMLALAVPGPRRASFFRGAAWGVLTGSWDGAGFDNAAGEAGRGAGHILAGFAIVGDVRDATADLWHRRWLDFGIDAVGLLPLVGDLAKGGRTAWRVSQRWRDAADTAQRLQRSQIAFDTSVRVARSSTAPKPDACRRT